MIARAKLASGPKVMPEPWVPVDKVPDIVWPS